MGDEKSESERGGKYESRKRVESSGILIDDKNLCYHQGVLSSFSHLEPALAVYASSVKNTKLNTGKKKRCNPIRNFHP